MDDDDENTFAHEAGRNFSIPHQENNPFSQENTPFIRETIFYTFANILRRGGGGGGEGEKVQVFGEKLPTSKWIQPWPCR